MRRVINVNKEGRSKMEMNVSVGLVQICQTNSREHRQTHDTHPPVCESVATRRLTVRKPEWIVSEVAIRSCSVV
jgi:hypothetical protein